MSEEIADPDDPTPGRTVFVFTLVVFAIFALRLWAGAGA